MKIRKISESIHNEFDDILDYLISRFDEYSIEFIDYYGMYINIDKLSDIKLSSTTGNVTTFKFGIKIKFEQLEHLNKIVSILNSDGFKNVIYKYGMWYVDTIHVPMSKINSLVISINFSKKPISDNGLNPSKVIFDSIIEILNIYDHNILDKDESRNYIELEIYGEDEDDVYSNIDIIESLISSLYKGIDIKVDYNNATIKIKVN